MMTATASTDDNHRKMYSGCVRSGENVANELRFLQNKARSVSFKSTARNIFFARISCRIIN